MAITSVLMMPSDATVSARLPHFFDGVFDLRDVPGIFYADGECHVAGLGGASGANEFANVAALGWAHVLRRAERDEDAAAAETADSGARVGVDDADDTEFFVV
jgi:hypothetical protein